MLIAIEGIDGSGKNTQAKLLVEKLKGASVRTALLSFPIYQSFFGKEIANYLNGEFGGMDDIHPKLSAMLYAGDRLGYKSLIETLLAEGKVLVVDRYVASNRAHQSAKVTGNERKELQDWISVLEYEEHGLPKADLNILLDVNAEECSNLILKKDKRGYTDKAKDLHEEDTNYLEEVSKVYRELAEGDDWVKISCYDENGLRSIEDIHEEVLKVVLEKEKCNNV